MNQFDFESKIKPLMAYVSHQSISEDTGISERTLGRYMRFDKRGKDTVRQRIYESACKIAATISHDIQDLLSNSITHCVAV